MSVQLLRKFTYNHDYRITRKIPEEKCLLTCIDDMVLEACLYRSLWKTPFKNISRCVHSHSLIFHVREYNNANEIIISIDQGEMKPQRDGDIPLIDIAADRLKKNIDLKSIQKVRVQLVVIYVSDIFSVDGRKMDTSFYTTKHIYKYRNTHDFPIKHHVNKVDYTAWKKLLKYTFRAENNTLSAPLGSWIQISSL